MESQQVPLDGRDPTHEETENDVITMKRCSISDYQTHKDIYYPFTQT